MTGALKISEEAKRERCWNPRQRWEVLQATIAWVEAQRKTPRNSPQACLAVQSQKLGRR